MKQRAMIAGMIVLGLLQGGCLSVEQPSRGRVTSPNGRHELSVSVSRGQLVYSVRSDGENIIEQSRLGLRFKKHSPLGENVRVVGIQTDSFAETWEQVWGEQRLIENRYNELLVTLVENGGEEKKFELRVRVFDDGFGFRYEIPKQDHVADVVIMDELTEFNFPTAKTVWWTPAYTEFYESVTRSTPVSEMQTANLPVTIETADGKFAAIHEANLTDYAAMNLYPTNGAVLACDLTPWSSGEKVFATAPFVSPWRMMILADRPGDLMTSRIELNLNEPCALKDTSWIRTGKYIGIWWGMHLGKYTWHPGPKHGATTENTLRYIDFAAEHGFSGVLVEGWNYGWEFDWQKDGEQFDFTQPYDDFNIQKITDYAKEKGVSLVGHHETGGMLSNYENQMEDAFAFYQKYGVHMVKTGYVGSRVDKKEFHSSQYGVRHFRKVVETAAKYQIMINNHEGVMQTGLRRTWPNLMAAENVRGQEYNAWSADGGNKPDHLTIIPFARGLAGPIDFTPGIFSFENPNNPKTRVQTTLAKQLALYVVIYSPWQMAADLPENYKNQPGLKFIEDVPTNWESTEVLDAKIGDYVAVIRKDRKSDDWYLGCITDEQSRSMSIPLDFLKAGRSYTAEIYRDGEGADWKTNPTSLTIEAKTVTSTDTLQLTLAAGGGTAIRFDAGE